jgi:hypothetical protein
MQNKLNGLALLLCAILFSFQFMACQKDKTVAGSLNAGSIDNGNIHTLPEDASLIAWYPFINGSLKDKSGHHNHIFSAGNVVATTSKLGFSNGAYYFNGTSSVMLADERKNLNDITGAITMAALIKPMGFYQGKCHGNIILMKGYGTNWRGHYFLGFDDQAFYNYNGCNKAVKRNKQSFYGAYGDNEGIISRDTDYLNLDKWYNLVFTYDGTVSKLYINGVLVSSVTGTVTFSRNVTYLSIGASGNGNYPSYFNGVIDEIRIYNRALSSDEVTGLNTLMGK